MKFEYFILQYKDTGFIGALAICDFAQCRVWL